MGARTLIFAKISFLAFFADAQRVLYVSSPPDLSQTYSAMAARWMGKQTANISVAVAQMGNVDGCSPAPADRPWCSGSRRAVLSDSITCSWETRARHALDAGCTVYIGKTNYPKVGGVLGGPYQFDGTNVDAYADMIIANTVRDDFNALQSALRTAEGRGEELWLRLTYTRADMDANPWVVLWASSFFRVVCWGVLPLLTLCGAAENARRLYLFGRSLRAFGMSASRRSSFSPSLMPTIILGLEMVGWAVRLVLAIDVCWSTHTLTRNTIQALTTLPVSILMVTSTLLILAWRDVLEGKKRSSAVIVRYRWQIGLFSGTLLAMEIALMVLRVTYTDTRRLRPDALTSVVYILYQLCVGAGFGVYGARIVFRLRALARRRSGLNSPRAASDSDLSSGSMNSSPRSGSGSSLSSLSSRSSARIPFASPHHKTRVALRMTSFLVLSSIAMFCSAVVWTGVIFVIQTPYGLFGVFAGSVLFTNLQATARMFVFPLPQERVRTSMKRSVSAFKRETSASSIKSTAAAV